MDELKTLSSYFDNAKIIYKDYISKFIPNFDTHWGYQHRIRQFDTIIKSIKDDFPFDEINLIETGVSGRLDYGLFGLMLGSLVSDYGGQMHSVDLDCDSCNSSKKIFSEVLPLLKYKTYCMDSISFLSHPPIIPNIVHLDSVDFDLYNPFPSALHCWKEFITIEKLMPSKSILIIDDNWIKGTFLQWITNNKSELIEVKYPLIGKGVHVYQEIKNSDTNWELIGNHYTSTDNIKLIFRKK